MLDDNSGEKSLWNDAWFYFLFLSEVRHNMEVSHDTLHFIVYDEGKQIWRVITFLRMYILDHEEIKFTILPHFPLFNNVKATIYTLKWCLINMFDNLLLWQRTEKKMLKQVVQFFFLIFKSKNKETWLSCKFYWPVKFSVHAFGMLCILQ